MGITRFSRVTPSPTTIENGKLDYQSRELKSLFSIYSGGRFEKLSSFERDGTSTSKVNINLHKSNHLQVDDCTDQNLYCQPCDLFVLEHDSNEESVNLTDTEVENTYVPKNNIYNIIVNKHATKLGIKKNCLCKKCVIREVNNMKQ